MDRKAILITGSASGIGRETARLFAAKGWFVGLMDIQAPQLSDLAGEIGEENCIILVADVTDMSGVSAAMEAFGRKTGGRLDLLFNCAGILRMGMHHKMDIDTQKQIVDINLNGILHCIHAAFRLLRQTRDACIVNMSSASSLYGTPELAVYSATKFAVSGLTEALNIEYEPFGIRVCDIIVAYVRTPMVLEAEQVSTSVERMGAAVWPEDVAQYVWRAAHGRKIHWKIGLATRLNALFLWMFPFLARRVMKTIAFSPGKGEDNVSI